MSPSLISSRSSLSRRLVAGALVWLVLMLGIGGFVLTLAFRDAVENGLIERLDATLRAMVASVEIRAGGPVTFSRPLGEPRFDQVFSGWYWQISDGAGLLIRSRSLWDESLPVHAAADGSPLEVGTARGPRGRPLITVERDIEFPDLPLPLHLTVAAERREIDAEVKRFGLLLAAALGTMGLGLLLAVVIQVRFGLKPLQQLAHDLEAVRSGVRARLGGGQPAEIAPLAEAMNAVLDHDEQMIERARTHVGNLAHGLKTPLAVLKAEAAPGTVPDPAVIAKQVTVMDRLVGHHLTRAAAVAGGSARVLGARVPVAPVLSDLAGALVKIHAERGIAVEVEAAPDAAFVGAREDLEEILGNLMDNACKWARGRVRATAGRRAGALVLVVEDDGPGMTEAEAAEAARRGARLDAVTPGFGLGLAIVTDLAALNGGSLTFGRSEMGGLRVEVAF